MQVLCRFTFVDRNLLMCYNRSTKSAVLKGGAIKCLTF